MTSFSARSRRSGFVDGKRYRMSAQCARYSGRFGEESPMSIRQRMNRTESSAGSRSSATVNGAKSRCKAVCELNPLTASNACPSGQPRWWSSFDGAGDSCGSSQQSSQQLLTGQIALSPALHRQTPVGTNSGRHASNASNRATRTKGASWTAPEAYSPPHRRSTASRKSSPADRRNAGDFSPDGNHFVVTRICVVDGEHAVRQQ